MSQIFIQFLGACTVSVNGHAFDGLAAKSHMGISVMEYLILQREKPVAKQRLIREIWGAKRIDSPGNALKTVVSRLRTLLNGLSPGLGNCIVSEQNGYRWETQPHVQVDVLELMTLLDELKGSLAPENRREKLRRLLKLYAGDLYQTGDLINGASLVSWLHKEYLDAVYSYIELLKETEEYNEICQVCQDALRVDDLDERIHIELMRAMVSLNRAGDAMTEYKRVVRKSRLYYDAEPGEDLQACYQELNEASKTLQFNLDTIRNELIQRDNERSGPFFCDYPAFKEIYNIQIRNLERLGSTMFLGVIMVGGPDETISAVSRESAMAGLQEILRRNLRKGDIVTRFSPTIYAMLLPTVNYSTGGVVMARIEDLFYEEYPNGTIRLRHRISPLGGPGK